MSKKRNSARAAEEVRGDFLRKGISISAWAKQHKLSRSLVHAVLSGRLTGRFGKSHKAAVLLGIKDGEIIG